MLARRTIEREADHNIELGRLLRLERDIEKQQAVEEILAGRMNILQKIDKIKRIDAGEEIQQDESQAEQGPTRQHIVRIQHNIKAPRKAVSYWVYLLYEYRRLKSMGRENYVFEAKIFPPSIRINPRVTQFLVTNLQPWAIELSGNLTLITEHGWMYLPKVQYNLIALLKKLCDRISKIDFVHMNYRDRNLVDKLRRLEIPFLVLLYRQEYLEALLSGLDIVYRKLGRRQEYEQVSILVMRVLSPDTSLPSFYNWLLGLNILKYHQLLSLNDLVRPGLGGVIYNADFDCDQGVRKKIEEHVETILDGIKSAHERLFEVRRFNDFVPYDGEGHFNPGVLRNLYESAEGGHDFNQDLNHIGLFTARLLRTFDSTFFSLLNGSVALVGAGKPAIFSRTFFEVELEKLRSYADQMDKSSLALASFAYDQYTKIKRSEKGALPQEKEIVQLIDESLSLMVEIGNTLGQVLDLSKTAAPAESEPLQPIMLQGKPVPLPHAERTLRSQGLLKNKSVRQGLELAVTSCFSSAVFLHDWYARMLLGKEAKYQEEIQKQIRQLESIATEQSIAELKTRYTL